MDKPIVLLFYKFIEIADPNGLRDLQLQICERFGLKGRILIAREGINGTLEGTQEAVDLYKAEMQKDPRFKDVVFKESLGTGEAFPKLKVKVRDEVVTLGAGEFNVSRETAPAITADELERLYETDDEFLVLDLRNDYEIDSGYFERTVDPGLRNFRDLPHKISNLAHLKNKKVVTVCTGGIRCEKATCLLKREGFTDVYQLKDGIHTYMQKYPGKRFKGTLFVFDNRMVTPVVDSPNRELVGECVYCGVKSEKYYANDTVKPSLKVICCNDCASSHTHELRSV